MFIQYIKPRLGLLSNRDFLIMLLMFTPDRKVAGDGIADGEIVFLKEGMTYENAEYGFYEGGKLIKIPKSEYGQGVPFCLNDHIELHKGDIANFSNANKITTTIGRYIINQVGLVETVNDAVPYMNETMRSGKDMQTALRQCIDKKIITVSDYRAFIDRMYFILHFGELSVPSISKRSLTTDPAIPQRKKELLEQYKDQLKDPKIIAKIENELIAMDMAWMKGDSAEGIYGLNPNKSYRIHRKKMHVMVGGVDSFDEDGGMITSTYSLSEGVSKKEFAHGCNEIRSGSYSRGKQTAIAGEKAKFMMRAFNDVTIVEDDCGATKGLPIDFSKVKVKNFIDRTLIINGKLVLITKDNQKSFHKTKQIMRSPLYCNSKTGYCYACSGMNLKRDGIQQPGAVATNITDVLLNGTMKAMHGTVIDVEEIDPFEFFVQ